MQNFGIIIQELPFQYLGVPIFKGHNKKIYYNDMIHKMEKLLSIWDHKNMNHGGRITLINSILNAMPIYRMQTLKFPSAVLDRIGKICNKFFWGSNEHGKKNH